MARGAFYPTVISATAPRAAMPLSSAEHITTLPALVSNSLADANNQTPMHDNGNLVKRSLTIVESPVGTLG
jgi:hypothetical protein